MSKKISLGTAEAQPGTIQYGRWDAFAHPTGHVEFLPVIIAQGKEDGPCIWLTAGIHGPEHTGPVVLYRLLTQELVDRLRGTIIALPALSPAGLRNMQREPRHARKDPNRLWPDGRPLPPLDVDDDPPTSLEVAYRRLFEVMTATGDYLIDYHNAWTGSLSFAFRDRVLYRADIDAEKHKAEADVLAEQQEEILAAYGHTIVTEFPPNRGTDKNLNRSTSGATLLVGKMPSFTVELGTGDVPDPAIVAASVAGTRNVLRWAGMLDGEMEPITGIKVVDPGFRVRRAGTPRVTEPCVVLHLCEAGDIVKVGDPVAEVRDVWGRPVGEGILRAEYDGFVIGRLHGIYYYPGMPIYAMAIRDESPVVAPYPADYFKAESAEEHDAVKPKPR